jgi:hypothetical protein
MVECTLSVSSEGNCFSSGQFWCPCQCRYQVQVIDAFRCGSQSVQWAALKTLQMHAVHFGIKVRAQRLV